MIWGSNYSSTTLLYKVVYLENSKSALGFLSNSTLLQFPQYLFSTHRQLSVLKNILTEMERETKRNMPAKALFLGPSIGSQYSSSIPGYIFHTDIKDILLVFLCIYLYCIRTFIYNNKIHDFWRYLEMGFTPKMFLTFFRQHCLTEN